LLASWQVDPNAKNFNLSADAPKGISALDSFDQAPSGSHPAVSE
jgi:hypothetical protein